MRRPVYILAATLLGAVFCGNSLSAKPLLSNSQKTHVSSCLERTETADRLVAVCDYALALVADGSTDWIDISLVLADVLFELNRPDRAKAAYRSVLDRDPEATDAHNGLGWIAHEANDMATAASIFQASIAVRPTAQGIAGRASALRHLDKIDQETFVTMIDAALALSPDYGWAAREKAWALMQDFNDMGAAEDAARSALSIDQDNIHSLYLIGYLLNELGRHGEAFLHLNDAAQSARVFTAIYEQRSLASFGNGSYKFALKDADRVIAGWPEDSTGYVRRARALEALGEREKAVRELEKFVENIHDDFALYWLADLHFNSGDIDKALNSLNRILSHGEPDFWTHQYLSYLYLESGAFDASRQHAQIAQRIDPGEGYPYLYEAMILVEDRSFETAEAKIKSAIERGIPEHSIRWFLEELMAKGEFVRAIQLRVSLRDDGLLTD